MRLLGRLRRFAALLAVVGLAVALSACGGDDGNGADDTTAPATGGSGITIADFKFTAPSVAAGSTVTVTNNDSATHTVTADDGTSFDVSIDAGKTATITAPAAGTYAFHCNIHSTMKATLTVT